MVVGTEVADISDGKKKKHTIGPNDARTRRLGR